MQLSATYSPEDNKLRLSASQRLEADLYARVKAAGFIWAPKQQIFVAPAWTPEREDLLLELCGEIGDEDTSLVERAEQRAERFEDYSENRATDAERARNAVSAITDGIPLGQPILVGHHSERHARKDAEKIENGMRRAVKMWETSEYWKERAESALRHAKYLERPDVRMRRIKGIESDIRVLKYSYTPHPGLRIMQQRWNAKDGDPEVMHVWVGPKGRGGRWVSEGSLPHIEAGCQRTIAHLERRLIYERAMLAESGGLVADKFNFEVGGKVCRRGEWFVIVKINRKNGTTVSLTVSGHWCATIQIEEVTDYREPEPGDTEKVQAVMKQLPLCNFRTEGCIEMTSAEWKEKSKYGDALAVRSFDAQGVFHWRSDKASPNVYRHRSRYFLRNEFSVVPVFLTDAKVVNPPTTAREPATLPERPAREVYTPRPKPEPTTLDAMRETLKAGVQVVSAPQLFPTPPDVARRMVDLAGVLPGHRVLEPSAGTGNILKAIGDQPDKVAVEISPSLVQMLARCGVSGLQIHQADFLACRDLGTFDRIVMNPPFEKGSDIKHIRHALTMLKPGGVLVAICANGPRQREKLIPIAETWEDLPADTFKAAGTGVNTALLVIRG